jgi:hypothetical protein
LFNRVSGRVGALDAPQRSTHKELFKIKNTAAIKEDQKAPDDVMCISGRAAARRLIKHARTCRNQSEAGGHARFMLAACEREMMYLLNM